MRAAPLHASLEVRGLGGGGRMADGCARDKSTWPVAEILQTSGHHRIFHHWIRKADAANWLCAAQFGRPVVLGLGEGYDAELPKQQQGQAQRACRTLSASLGLPRARRLWVRSAGTVPGASSPIKHKCAETYLRRVLMCAVMPAVVVRQRKPWRRVDGGGFVYLEGAQPRALTYPVPTTLCGVRCSAARPLAASVLQAPHLTVSLPAQTTLP